MTPSFPVRRVALATWFPRNPATPKGGVEAVSVNLAGALARQDGLEVHVVTLDAGVQQPEITLWQCITIHRLPRGGAPLLRFATGAGRRLIQDYLRGLQPDVVHAHDTFGLMTQGLDLPRVFTIHGFIHEDTRYAGGLKARCRALLWKRAELATWAEQPHVVAISPYVRERLAGIARGVVHDIENPIAPEGFALVREEQAGVIFSAAVICERKNTLGLVQAFARVAPRHPGARLRLAGPITEPAYGEKIQACIRGAGLEESVVLLGSLPAPVVREELARASIFALVSFEEGAPMGIAEAMAAGLPILTSNRCGMPYMVRHGESGFLVDPRDPADITWHLDQLLSDATGCRRIGTQARAAAERLFHPDRVAERTLSVYNLAFINYASQILRCSARRAFSDLC
jgi:glycosyltransferase involved in cell wall biosynthesis